MSNKGRATIEKLLTALLTEKSDPKSKYKHANKLTAKMQELSNDDTFKKLSRPGWQSLSTVKWSDPKYGATRVWSKPLLNNLAKTAGFNGGCSAAGEPFLIRLMDLEAEDCIGYLKAVSDAHPSDSVFGRDDHISTLHTVVTKDLGLDHADRVLAALPDKSIAEHIKGSKYWSSRASGKKKKRQPKAGGVLALKRAKAALAALEKATGKKTAPKRRKKKGTKSAGKKKATKTTYTNGPSGKTPPSQVSRLLDKDLKEDYIRKRITAVNANRRLLSGGISAADWEGYNYEQKQRAIRRLIRTTGPDAVEK